MKSQIIRAAATTVLGLGLTTGFAAADSGTINNSGANANSHVTSTTHNSAHMSSVNKGDVVNGTMQSAQSGNAKVYDVDNGGSAASGDASNASTSSVWASESNTPAAAPAPSTSDSGSTDGTINNSGYEADSSVSSHTTNTYTSKETNEALVANVTYQQANSGNASVSNTVNGGSATTGAASNTSNSTVEVDLSN